jgi:transposase
MNSSRLWRPLLSSAQLFWTLAGSSVSRKRREDGKKRREKGLARSGNPRVRRGMIQLAWRFLMFQKDSGLAQWFRARTENARGTRKTMIVALARKLLIALWRLVREGVVPDGVILRPAQ